MAWSDIVWVSLLGGLLSLDRAVAFQFMVSRPIVAGPLIGLLLGHIAVGAVIGGLLELIWSANRPIGGHLPPHETLAAIVATAGVALASPDGAGPAVLMLGFLLAPPVARLGVALERRQRYFNGWLARRYVSGALDGRPEILWRLNLAGLGATFVSNALFIAAAALAATLILVHLPGVLPAFIHRALDMMMFLAPLIGAAAALSNFNTWRCGFAFGVSFVCALALFSL